MDRIKLKYQIISELVREIFAEIQVPASDYLQIFAAKEQEIITVYSPTQISVVHQGLASFFEAHIVPDSFSPMQLLVHHYIAPFVESHVAPTGLASLVGGLDGLLT